MQTPLNTLDTKKTIDYDNLNIVTRPRPPRRRQSGISLVPFRPYVKRLTSVRQPFSWTNGFDKWMVMGKNEIFFTQPNARCIGSLMEDCQTSDVIRWDIEGASTRLPMMCKLWMIVDGAVVERGKPHLVQDAAMQVFTSGRNLRAIMASRQDTNQNSMKRTYDRRRRQSWHDVNEYHSVPYHQYTLAVQTGLNKAIQCNMDNEYFVSKQEILPFVEEEVVRETTMNSYRKIVVQDTIQHSPMPIIDRVHVSIKIQTETKLADRSTSTDPGFAHMFNLNFEKNEILLSAIANPYRRAVSSSYLSDGTSFYRNNIEYKHRAVSTGDDYPHWWIRYDTDFILSDSARNQHEEKEIVIIAPPPPPPPVPAPAPIPIPRIPSLIFQHNQSVQTDFEKSRSSMKSSPFHQSSSSSIAGNHYELIDENEDKSHGKPYCPICDDKKFTSHSYESIQHQNTSSSSSLKRSENDYNIFVSSLNDQNRSLCSTSDCQKPLRTIPHIHNNQIACYCCLNDITRTRIKSSASTSTILLASLLERYERTLLDRQRAFDIAADELFNIDHVLRRYRQQMQDSSLKQTNMAMEVYRDISSLPSQPKYELSPSIITRVVTDKYRAMPGLTSDDMIKGYIPSPRIHITNTFVSSEEHRQPRYMASSKAITRPGYCDLCLTDGNTGSAWVKYNERRVEELQKRIDVMLKIQDNEELQALLSRPIHPIPRPIAQRIDDMLLQRSKYRSSYLYDYYRMPPCRYPHRLLHRLNEPLPNSPRLLSSRSTSCLTKPVSKKVRISTQSVPPRTTNLLSPSPSAPIIPILRRKNTRTTSPSTKFDEPSHIWRNNLDDELYVLTQYTIPRYYRLYSDVNFRKMYDFSRLLDTCLDSSHSLKDYSLLVKDFALEQPSLSHITSIA